MLTLLCSIFLRAPAVPYPAVPLTTYPATPLFYFTLTLLYPYFSADLTKCALRKVCAQQKLNK